MLRRVLLIIGAIVILAILFVASSFISFLFEALDKIKETQDASKIVAEIVKGVL